MWRRLIREVTAEISSAECGIKFSCEVKISILLPTRECREDNDDLTTGEKRDDDVNERFVSAFYRCYSIPRSSPDDCCANYRRK